MSTPDAARARSALHAIDAGIPREQWHEIGRAALAAGLTLEDVDEWSASAPNYRGRKDIDAAFRTIEPNGGTGAGTLYFHAQQHGWREAKNGAESARADAKQSPPSGKQKTAPRPDPAVVWARCEPANELHGYVVAKTGRPEGLRVVSSGDSLTIAGHRVAGWLVIPAHSNDGTLRTIQFVSPVPGEPKLSYPGAQFSDGMFIVGDIAESDRTYIVEGIGQAWACWRATGHAAAVSFGAGRMATVAGLLRQRFPTKRPVIVPDRGKENLAADIARSVGGEWVGFPESKPANYDANDFAAEHGAEDLAELLSKAAAPPMRYRVLTAADLMNAPPLRWLVRGVLPAHGLACQYGASGSGKSFLALSLSAAIAEGVPWFDCRVTQAPVTYVVLEGEYGFRQRVKAWQLHHGRHLPANLRFVMQAFDLRNADDLAGLADAAIASGGANGLVVLDTLNRAAGGADENSSADMGELIDSSRALQSKLGGTVLLVHHAGKDAAKGLRGHSSLHAALDAAIEVTRNDTLREWRIAKSKDGDDGAAHAFRLEAVEVGIDEDGEPITSCVVAPDEGAADAVRRVQIPRGGNQRIAYDCIGQLLRDARHFGQEGAPPSRPCITLESAIAGIRERLTCAKDQRTRSAQTAITGLLNAGCIELKGGWLWLR